MWLIVNTDVIGVVKDVHELGSVTSKATQKPVGCLFPEMALLLGFLPLSCSSPNEIFNWSTKLDNRSA
jgi:hypothetical protein